MLSTQRESNDGKVVGDRKRGRQKRILCRVCGQPYVGTNKARCPYCMSRGRRVGSWWNRGRR